MIAFVPPRVNIQSYFRVDMRFEDKGSIVVAMNDWKAVVKLLASFES